MQSLQGLTKPLLQELLVKHKLKKSGNKPILIKRLVDFYNANPSAVIQSKELTSIDGKFPSNVIITNQKNSKDMYVYGKGVKCHVLLTQTDVSQLLLIIKNNKFSLAIKELFHISIENKINETFKFYKLELNSSSNMREIKYNSFFSKSTLQKLYELKNLFQVLEHAQKNINQIIKIQKWYKLRSLKQFNKMRGPGFIRRSSCKNTEDFITYEEIKYIHPNYIYTIKDENDGMIYGFNILSLIQYINFSTKIINPYNTTSLAPSIIMKAKELYKILIDREIIKPMSPPKLSDELMMRDKAIKVFHHIDMLGNYTDVNWFLNLNIYELKKLYHEAEDIWNYRAMHLTTEARRAHIPNNDAFKLKPYEIKAMNDKLQIQNIILDEFHKFITEGVSVEECKTGALWMLTALVKVSPQQAESMAWLIQ